MSGSPRIEKAPLFVEAWEGVLTRLRDMYSAKSGIIGSHDITVLPCANPDALEKMLQAQATKIDLPAIGVGITNVEPNTSSFNVTAMRKHGYQLAVDETRDNWYMLKANPVIMTFQVTFVTDDVMTMLRIIDRWQSTEHWGFQLQLSDSTKMTFKIVVEADKNVAVPPASPSLGGSDQYKLATNLRVQTYSGYLWRVPSIRQFQIDLNLSKTSDIQKAIDDPAKYGVDVLEKVVHKIVLEPEY